MPGLIEVITSSSSAAGERHAHLAEHVGKIAINAWAGGPDDPDNEVGGAVWQLGVNWIPYQLDTFVTPAFPGYVSGHSTFSRSAAEVLTQFTGSPYFPDGLGTWTASTEYLQFEKGPTTEVTLQWATYYDAADEAGVSRRWGGIHIAADDWNGRIMGAQIGHDAYDLATQYFTGTLAFPALRAGGEYVLMEGHALHLKALLDSTLDPATVEWDLNNDGIFGDVVGAEPLVSWSTLNAFGIVDGPSNHQIQVRANDGLGGPPVVASTWVNVFNVKPTAHAGGPYTIRVGDPLTLNASNSFDPVDGLTFAWDLNGDGIFEDAFGVNPTLTSAQLTALGVYGNPKTLEVRVRVSDGQPNGTAVSAATTLTLVDLLPYTFNLVGGASQLTVTGTYVPLEGPGEPLNSQPGSTQTIVLDGMLAVDLGPEAVVLSGGSSIFAINQGSSFLPGGSDANVGLSSITPNLLSVAIRSAVFDAISGFASLNADGEFSTSSLKIAFTSGSSVDYQIDGNGIQQFGLDSLGQISNLPAGPGTLVTAGNFWMLTIPIELSFEIVANGGERILIDVAGQIVATTPLPAFNDVAPWAIPLASGPMSLPGAIAAGDFDGDGYVDLFIARRDTGAGYRSTSEQPVQSALYRNRGDGTFEDVTESSGIGIGMYANAAGWADLNNNGHLDLYVTSWMSFGQSGAWRNYLFINDGTGHFTEEAVLRGADISRVSPMRWSEGVAFGDFDNDGYLDMLVAELNWGPNAAHEPYTRLLRNRGAEQPGYFEDVTVEAGLDWPLNRYGVVVSYTPMFADMDNDGLLDILIVGDFDGSSLWWNNGDGTFTDGTAAAGVSTEKFGMGSTIADVNGDGYLDWFVTSIYSDQSEFTDGNRLYLNNGNRTFTDATDVYNVRAGQWGWGAEFFDFDNDGLLDLVMTNGFDDIAGMLADEELVGIDVISEFVADPTILWRNVGGTMQDVSIAMGINDKVVGRGIVIFDYNADGRLDFIVANDRSRPVLYRNNLVTDNNYVRILLEGTR